VTKSRLLISGFALSIDNLVIGFALGTYQVAILTGAIVIGLVSVALSMIGLELGARLGKMVRPAKRATGRAHPDLGWRGDRGRHPQLTITGPARAPAALPSAAPPRPRPGRCPLSRPARAPAAPLSRPARAPAALPSAGPPAPAPRPLSPQSARPRPALPPPAPVRPGPGPRGSARAQVSLGHQPGRQPTSYPPEITDSKRCGAELCCQCTAMVPAAPNPLLVPDLLRILRA
jgi:hypothetical protein